MTFSRRRCRRLCLSSQFEGLAKRSQHFSATSCNIVAWWYDMCWTGWPNARTLSTFLRQRVDVYAPQPLECNKMDLQYSSHLLEHPSPFAPYSNTVTSSGPKNSTQHWIGGRGVCYKLRSCNTMILDHSLRSCSIGINRFNRNWFRLRRLRFPNRTLFQPFSVKTG